MSAPDASGLREAVEALAAKWDEDRKSYPVRTNENAAYAEVAVRLCGDELRALLAAHPAEADPTAGERECPSRCGRNEPCANPWHDRPATPPADDASEGLSEAEQDDFRANLRQNLGYRAWVIEDAMLGHVERIVAARVSAAATRARAEGAAEAAERIAQAIESEREQTGSTYGWHQGCRAGLAEAARIARSDAAPDAGGRP